MSFHRLHKLILELGDADTARRIQSIAGIAADERLRVVVFGDFNRGKSTLINALLGRSLLQAKLIPTTGHVTQVVHGKPDQLVLNFRDGKTESVSLTRHNEIATLNAEGKVREDIELLTVAVDAPLLSCGLALIDTPGRNEASRQSDRTAAALMSADVVIWLLDARQCLHEREREMTLTWLSDRPGVLLLPVVNFMNLLDEEERRDVRTRLDAWGKEGLHELTGLARTAVGKCYFEVNARGALLSATAAATPPKDDFASLAAELQRLGGPARGEVCRGSRAAQNRALLEPLSHQNGQRLVCLNATLDAARKDRDSRRNDVRQELRAIEAKAGTQKELLASAAATILNEKRNSVQRRFENETKAWLEQYADDWYETNLLEGVAEIERLTDRTLAELARSAGLPSLAGMSLIPHGSLTVRLVVNSMEPTKARDDEEVEIGTMTRQDRRTARRAARQERRSERREARAQARSGTNDADVYLAQAAANWSSSQISVLAELGRKFDAGLRSLKAKFDTRLSAIDGECDDPTVLVESARRKEAEGLIHDLLAQSGN